MSTSQKINRAGIDVANPQILRHTCLMKHDGRPALLFIGGEHPDAKRVASLYISGSLLIAADSGYDTARSLGFQPTVLIGDMDSIREMPEEKKEGTSNTIILRFPAAKDYTDTELALDWLRKHGHQRCFLIGGGGGRLEHLLGIHAIFQRYEAPDRWYTESDEIVLIRKSMVLSVGKGSVLSFFPLGKEKVIARSSGLRWPLDALEWSIGDCGISNIADMEKIDVTVLAGRLLMVRSLHHGQVPLDPLL